MEWRGSNCGLLLLWYWSFGL